VLTRQELFQIIAVLLTLTALFSFIRLPTTFGVMLIALIASLAFIALQHFGFSIGPMAARVLQSVDFGQTLLQGMLSFVGITPKYLPLSRTRLSRAARVSLFLPAETHKNDATLRFGQGLSRCVCCHEWPVRLLDEAGEGQSLRTMPLGDACDPFL